MTTSHLLPVLALLASLSGVLLIAAIAGARATADRRDLGERPNNLGCLRIGAWGLVAGIAAGLGAGLTIAVFAMISALALATFFALAPAQPRDRVLRLACYAAVPLQYVFVATQSFELFAATLPLAATLGLPLLALAGRDTRELLDRVTTCGWGVLVCVYCVSHAGAILMLDVPGFAGRNGLLVAFLVIVAGVDGVRRGVFELLARRPAHDRYQALPRIALGVAVSGLVGAALGAALASLTPFPPSIAGMVGLLLALAGALGGFVMSSMARARPDALSRRGNVWQRVLGRPGAIAFAAPVYFHLLHALYGGWRY